MATHSMANLMRSVLALALVGLTTAPFAAPANADGLKPGDVLDKSTAAQAEGMMPPEILQHYKEGKFQNKVVDWPSGVFRTASTVSAQPSPRMVPVSLTWPPDSA